MLGSDVAWGLLLLHEFSGCDTVTAMFGGRSPRHAQNPLSGERRKTLSITHHALSPPPLHHHLYIIHLINWLQRFYGITMSLRRPFVPKSDGKQWFTTTVTAIPFPARKPLRLFCAVCESKHTMHKPVLLLGPMYQRLVDQTIFVLLWLCYNYFPVKHMLG